MSTQFNFFEIVLYCYAEVARIFRLGGKTRDTIGFWGLLFIQELQRWYWDSGSGIPILDIRYREILQSSEETLEL